MTKPQRSTLLLVLAVSLVLPAWSQRAAGSRPNILLIVSDDQGYADLGCCGDPELRTPNLDRLASEGIRLTSFYVSWPACTPSRGSILTGRYPQRNGLYDMIRNNEVDYGHRFTEAEYAVSPEMTLGLDLREVVIAQPLKKAGYRTAVVGKWDSGRARRFLPLQRGFDFFYGFCNTGIDYFTHERYGVPSMFRGNELVKEEGYATHLFEREALNFLREESDQPFFLYVAFNAPHSASNLDRPGPQAPEEYAALYGAPPHPKRRNHRASLTAMDESIGHILEELERMGVADNTLVVFFSDNGGSGLANNGPLRGRKAQMFEGGLRVPLLARWPGRISAGVVSDAFLTTLEIFPSLLAVAGAARPDGVVLDGFNMMPVLGGDAESQRREMYWQRRGDRAARFENWKWVESEAGGGLFDLSTDVGEQQDLSSSEPERLARMKALWGKWRQEMDAAEPRGPFRDY